MDFTSVNALYPVVDTPRYQQLNRLAELFADWNGRVNLVSRKDIEHLWDHHLVHCLSLARFIQFAPGTRVLDLGTGGGLPGLPMAILFPESEFMLLDATGKKVRVIQDMIDQLGLTNVSARWGRAEDLAKEHGRQFDFVLGRAVTALPAFWALAKPFIHCRSANTLPNGVLYLKGGEVEDELKQLKVRAIVHHLKDFLAGEYFETKLLLHLTDCPPVAQAK